MNSSTSYTANGTTATFTVPFEYVDRRHISVMIGGVLQTDYTFVSDTQVQLPSAPANGVVVTITRTTPIDAPYTLFRDGGVVRGKDLNSGFIQALCSVGELADKLNLYKSELDSAVLDGAQLPSAEVNNSTVLYSGGSWQTKTPTEFKAALGLSNEYIRATQRTAYNVSLDSYPSGMTWIARGLTNIETDDTGVAALDSGSLTVPAGRYRIQAVCYWNIEDHIAVRVKDQLGNVILGPLAVFSDRSTSTAATVSGIVNFADAVALTVETAASGFDNSPGSQGIAHGIADFGDNVYTILELQKIS